VIEPRTFAIRVYSAAGIAEACLELQDNAGVDVPLLLFCGWYAVYGGTMPHDVFLSVRQSAQELSEQVIRPLRSARRWMKNRRDDEAWNGLRDSIKQAELNAELLLLDQLQQQFTPEKIVENDISVQRVLNSLKLCLPENQSERHLQLLQQVAEACTQA